MTMQKCVDVLDQHKGKPVLHAVSHGGSGRMSEVKLTCKLCMLLTGGLLQAPSATQRGAFVIGEGWVKRCRSVTELTRQVSSADL